MPTQHVEPGSDEHLQDVANALFKARKVVVVTGAGISTNSGIPDFRSENGLYSLIQAQFDAAARLQQSQDTSSSNESEEDESEDPRPTKRQRMSREATVEIHNTIKVEVDVRTDVKVCIDTNRAPLSDTIMPDALAEQPVPSDLVPAAGDVIVCTPKPTRLSLTAGLITTSPLSSPPMDLIPPSAFRSSSRNSLFQVPFPLSSSPLSSPPLDFFDSFDSDSSDASPSRRSSTADSELDDTLTSNNFSSSQSSTGRASLPNMKGKDLFDASVWADPLRTSVFYTFATSLRQKVKEAEPTASHKFISHLKDRGKLVRCYTQNIDRIEEKVGLSTSLTDGPGSRGRFSRRSTANACQLNKMVAEASQVDALGEKAKQTNDAAQTAKEEPDTIDAPAAGAVTPTNEQSAAPPKPPKLEPSRSSGVECVFLHGSLESLRCFLCGRVSSWDDALEIATLSGQQPECPHCIGATAAREERGKRALGVGKLRPDIVLYGEEHPNAHLISPVVTHDLSLSPDLLLILGTSLRVHGLKVMVREFARAIHNRGGKVVFVNFTKPPESSWGDVIDYWVQWDCDAWVDDLQSRIPKLWEPPQPPRRIAKKTEEEKELERRLKPPAANPVALRDTKATGAYWTLKIMDELCRITGNPSLVRTPPIPPPKPSMKAKDSEQKPRRTKPRPSLTSPVSEPITMAEPMVETNMDESTQPTEGSSPIPSDEQSSPTPNDASKASQPRTKRPRKSATGAVRRTRNKPSTLNPNHGRPSKAEADVQTSKEEGRLAELSPPSPTQDARTSISSILNSVKTNPRIRKRKKIYGDQVGGPAVGASVQKSESELTLAPLLNASPQSPPQLDHRPQPMEPPSPPPPGPVAEPISRFTNSFGFAESLRNALDFGRRDAKAIQDDLDRTWQWPGHPPQPQVQQQSHHMSVQWQQSVAHYEPPEPQVRPAEHEAALALAGLGVQERISSWMRWKFF